MEGGGLRATGEGRDEFRGDDLTQQEGTILTKERTNFVKEGEKFDKEGGEFFTEGTNFDTEGDEFNLTRRGRI